MTSNIESYWRNKKIVITGASSGLGAAIVAALASFNVQFGLLSRRIEPMRELEAQHSKRGSEFWIRQCDVRKREDVETAVDEFVSARGVPDVAWINSGVVGDTSFERWNWDVVENMIETNLKGAIYTAHSCLKHMVPRGQGTVVAISSAAAMRGLGGRSIYSMTKIALAYYMESMAAELQDIQFTTIFPGFVDTPANRTNPNRFWLLTAEDAAQRMIRAVARKKPTYIYPFKMRMLFHAIRSLPAPVYRRLARRMMNVTRPGK